MISFTKNENSLKVSFKMVSYSCLFKEKSSEAAMRLFNWKENVGRDEGKADGEDGVGS